MPVLTFYPRTPKTLEPETKTSTHNLKLPKPSTPQKKTNLVAGRRPKSGMAIRRTSRRNHLDVFVPDSGPLSFPGWVGNAQVKLGGLFGHDQMSCPHTPKLQAATHSRPNIAYRCSRVSTTKLESVGPPPRELGAAGVSHNDTSLNPHVGLAMAFQKNGRKNEKTNKGKTKMNDLKRKEKNGYERKKKTRKKKRRNKKR